MLSENETEFRGIMHIIPVQIVSADSTARAAEKNPDFARFKVSNTQFRNVFQSLADQDSPRPEVEAHIESEEVHDTSGPLTCADSDQNDFGGVTTKVEIDEGSAALADGYVRSEPVEPTRKPDEPKGLHDNPSFADFAPQNGRVTNVMKTDVYAWPNHLAKGVSPVSDALSESSIPRQSRDFWVQQGRSAQTTARPTTSFVTGHEIIAQTAQITGAIQPSADTTGAFGVANGSARAGQGTESATAPPTPSSINQPLAPEKGQQAFTDGSSVRSDQVARGQGPVSHEPFPLPRHISDPTIPKSESVLTSLHAATPEPFMPTVKAILENGPTFPQTELFEANALDKIGHPVVGSALAAIHERSFEHNPATQPLRAGVSPETLVSDPHISGNGAETDLVMDRIDPVVLAPSAQSGEGSQLRADVHRFPTAQAAQILARHPDQPLEIALNPEELGRVRMSLSTSETAVTMVITTERPETLDLMRRHIDQLAQDLQALGFDKIGFEFRHGQSGDQEEFGTIRQDASADDHNSDDNETPPLPATRSATAGLDLRL